MFRGARMPASSDEAESIKVITQSLRSASISDVYTHKLMVKDHLTPRARPHICLFGDPGPARHPQRQASAVPRLSLPWRPPLEAPRELCFGVCSSGALRPVAGAPLDDTVTVSMSSLFPGAGDREFCCHGSGSDPFASNSHLANIPSRPP